MKLAKPKFGHAYAWGNSQMLQLAGSKSHLKKPSLLPKLQHVHKVGCAEYNLIASFKKDDKYVIHGFGEFKGVPTNEYEQFDLQERALDLGGSSAPVSQIACGQQHYMILLESGELFTWGSSHEGQLGHGDMDPQRNPKRIEEFKDVPIKKIAAGWLNSFAISQDGDMYAWGSNHFSQLGTNTMYPENTPMKVEVLEGRKTDLIAAGLFHVLVHTENQDLIAFGRIGKNRRGSIHMDLNGEFKDDKVIQISSGLYHCLVLTESGKLYSFGGNEEGQLGLDSLQPVARPQLVEHFADYKVKRIECGPHHNLAVTEDDQQNTQLWAWGLGQDWQLGTELRQNEIMEMALGYGHTVVVTESKNPNVEEV